jgi:hypothetical protein
VIPSMLSLGMKASDVFEQQIHRIYELLQGSGAQVTWNDHIPDPDNPSQSRQIDVTTRRDTTLTLVECRERGSPQDVTWIEELIGRRPSLGGDAVIATEVITFRSCQFFTLVPGRLATGYSSAVAQRNRMVLAREKISFPRDKVM